MIQLMLYTKPPNLIFPYIMEKQKHFSRMCFVFAISHLKIHQNLKILVSTPQGIKGGMDLTFQVLIIFELRNCKEKTRDVFAFLPFDI
jgi:hypothetical protein